VNTDSHIPVHLLKVTRNLRLSVKLETPCTEPLVMVFNATFNNISVISWQSVLLMEETGGPRENCQPATSHWQIWSHNVVYSTPHL